MGALTLESPGKVFPCMTSDTSPTKPLPLVGARVRRVKGVPVLAVGLSGMMGTRAVAPMGIRLGGDGLKMRRIKAVPNSAKVIQLHPIGNGTNEGFVCCAVYPGKSLSEMHDCVALVVEVSRPEPTAIVTGVSGQPFPERKSLHMQKFNGSGEL